MRESEKINVLPPPPRVRGWLVIAFLLLLATALWLWG